jgi:hypothetical protein
MCIENYTPQLRHKLKEVKIKIKLNKKRKKERKGKETAKEIYNERWKVERKERGKL